MQEKPLLRFWEIKWSKNKGMKTSMEPKMKEVSFYGSGYGLDTIFKCEEKISTGKMKHPTKGFGNIVHK